MASKRHPGLSMGYGGKAGGKRRKTKENNEQPSRDESNSSASGSSDEEEEPESQEEVDLDFEGRALTEHDFHGIKMLLHPLLVTLPLNLTKLANMVTAQTSVGSTLKVADDDENTVYGFCTLIDLSADHEKKAFAKELVASLKERNKQLSNEKVTNFFELLKDRFCLLLNERFINIPSEVSVPMLQSLRSEINEAQRQGSLPQVAHVLLIAKSVKAASGKDLEVTAEIDGGSSGSTKKKVKQLQDVSEEQLQFVNEEDEFFYKECSSSFSYSVTNATGFAVSGDWAHGDVALDTYRTAMLIEFNKFECIVQNLENNLK